MFVVNEDGSGDGLLFEDGKSMGARMKKLIIILMMIVLASCAKELTLDEAFGADSKVSELPVLGVPPEGTDDLYIIDDGVSSQISVTNLLGVLDGEGITNDTIDEDSIDFGTGTDQVSLLDLGLAITHDTASELDALYEGADATITKSGANETITGTWSFSNGISAGTSANPQLGLDVTTASDTDWWVGVNADAGGDNDDNLEFRTSTTPGSSVHSWLEPDTGDIAFEGATDNAFHLLFDIEDPTAIRTVTFADNNINFNHATDNYVLTYNNSTRTWSGEAVSVDYDNTTGSIKSLTPVTDAATDFAANFIGADLYGGTFVCDTTGTIQLPAVAVGMNFTIITLTAIAIVVEPNSSDLIVMDGLAMQDADSATNTSTAGDIIVFQYYNATGWMATSNGWTDED